MRHGATQVRRQRGTGCGHEPVRGFLKKQQAGQGRQLEDRLAGVMWWALGTALSLVLWLPALGSSGSGRGPGVRARRWLECWRAQERCPCRPRPRRL